LGQEDEADMRNILRKYPSNDLPIIQAIKNAIALKPKGHDFNYSRKKVSGNISRNMNHTGG
jgi:cyclic pyranopterin phosphate synthase